MANYGNSYTIRSFNGWGAVYRSDCKVFEGEESRCKDYVLDEVGATHEKDCAFIADNDRAAEFLSEARRARRPNG